ncbi:RICIN domain-containing protein [Actinoplanes sp. TRM 88003]|uniref:RICIN domain-containing protein n=1 Tax=Paractinoplanes aksuensis TaxID=2939490 RepID=A0ABT1E3X7_9ACTN|nr:RICIN domain-containing protein [Actinoplanes aksuensis]MCO8276951.1 RICIN domain-containing protein [Actinoplanes aksuensis]
MTTSHRAPAEPRGHRRAVSRQPHRLLPVALGLALLGVGGVVGPSVVETVTDNSESRSLSLTSLPADQPAEGLVYEGLKAARTGTLCAGSYELDQQTCTHGPSEAPTGLQVRRDVIPVTAKAPEPKQPARESAAATPSDAEIARDEGGSALTADAPALVPDAAPGDADFIMGAHDVACEGDGRSGKRVQVLYLHEFGTPSRYGDFLGSIRTWSSGVDQIYDASAAATGGSRHIRYVTTPQCRVDVSEVELPAGGLTSFTRNIDELRKLGYNRTDRKYLVFADAKVYCGIATYVADRRPGLGNRNNGGPSYSRVDAGCWSSAMAARQLTYSLGATLIGSPNSSGAGGCVDEYDLLCGPDRSRKKMRDVCPKKNEIRLDCGNDDYFNTNPAEGSYLNKNWNVARSEFLLRSDGGDDIPDAEGAPPPAASPSPAGADPAPSTPAGPDPTPTLTAPEIGDASPSAEVTPSSPATTGEPTVPIESPSAEVPELPVAATTTPPAEPAAEPVQAVLEVRDATSGSVRLNWSAASARATYQVSVDGQPVATTQATRARLIGLKPDAKYQVTIKSGSRYTAKATADTAPAARPAQNSWFTLTNALTGGAADLYGARTALSTPLTLGGNDDDAQQQWKLVPAGKKSYTLVSRATGKCVGPLGGNADTGVPLVQSACDDTAVRWVLQASAYGFTLRTAEGDLVAGVGDQRFGAHRVLVLQAGNGQRYQSWTAVPD